MEHVYKNHILPAASGKSHFSKCFPFKIPTVRGLREEGRIAPEKCRSMILEGMPPQSPGVILDTNQVTDHCVAVMARNK